MLAGLGGILSADELPNLDNKIIYQDVETTIGIRTSEIQPKGHIWNKDVYVIKDAGAGYKIEVGCHAKVDDGMGGFFHEVYSTWSVASDNGNYTWDPLYVTATISDDGRYLTLQSSGYVEVAIDSSLTGSAGINLIAADFEISGTTTQTTYYRKRFSVNEKIYIGDVT